MLKATQDGRSEVNFVRKMETSDENDLDIESIQEVFIMTQHHKYHMEVSKTKDLDMLALNKEKSMQGIFWAICFMRILQFEFVMFFINF